MSSFPSVTGKDLIKALNKCDFKVIRIKGSHHFLRHEDGRRSVVPVHKNETIGIGAALHYPRPLHLQKAYDFMGHKRGAFPVAEQAADRVLRFAQLPGDDG